jgi:hypothetical protein
MEYPESRSQATGQRREIRDWYQEAVGMRDGTEAEGRQVYQIRVQGRLDKRRSVWFERMTMGLERTSDDMQITTLTGAVADQARLRGILSKLWDMNLTLLSVARIEMRETKPEHDRAER